MKRIHMHAGLLTFSALIVWGLTGVHAVFGPPPGGYAPPEVSEVREIPFAAPGDLNDRDLARRIYEEIALPMSGGHYNIRRDKDMNLAFFIFSVNGRRDISYLEDREMVRIAYRRNGLLNYISGVHADHSGRGTKEISARMWGYYNELSAWAFLFMTLSGVYLWAVTRPGLRWAQITLGAAAVVIGGLWMVTR